MKREVEVFTAGCGICDDLVQLVNRIACSSCNVTIQDTNNIEVRERAKAYGIKTIPAVVINGKLADCCASGGYDEATLRAAGLGQQ